jgi:hypothetical protein
VAAYVLLGNLKCTDVEVSAGSRRGRPRFIHAARKS